MPRPIPGTARQAEDACHTRLRENERASHRSFKDIFLLFSTSYEFRVCEAGERVFIMAA